jgi:hypothetical protein
MTIVYRRVPRKRIALAAFAMSLLVATTACSPSTASSGGATPDVASSNIATPDAATPSPSMTAHPGAAGAVVVGLRRTVSA